MLGTKIVMDEDKILKEYKHDLSKVYKAIDEYANECGLMKQDKFTYICREDDEQDFPHLMKFTHLILMKSLWFRENVKEWIWLDDEEGNSDLIEATNKLLNKGHKLCLER